MLGLETEGEADAVRQVVIRARDRVGESFETFMTERGASSSDQETAAFLMSSANHLVLAGDLLGLIGGVMGYSARSCEEGAREVRGQVRVLLDAYGGLADQLHLSRKIGPEFQVSTAALRQAELNCLRRWQTDPAVGRGAMAVVMAGEWALNLARLEADLEGAASSAAQAARRPWWR